MPRYHNHNHLSHILYLYGMVQPVQGIHIQRGIERYKGVLDTELKTLLAKSNMPYDPYQFADGRVLLVDTVLNFGFLYSTREEVFAKLQLED